MLDIFKDEEEGNEEEDDEDDEEAESSSDDDIKDDFIDWNIDCKVEVLKAKKHAIFMKKNTIMWSGQEIISDYDP
jgi:hypothetical protein